MILFGLWFSIFENLFFVLIMCFCSRTHDESEYGFIISSRRVIIFIVEKKFRCLFYSFVSSVNGTVVVL
jgi:hypothetical protein